jgi:hypothetical protein
MNPSATPSAWPPESPTGPISYRRAAPEDAAALAPKLRFADLAEMALVWDGTPETRLAESIRVSDEAWAALVDGEVVALFGLVRFPTAHSPWMRCAAEVENHPRALLEGARAWLDSVRDACVPLINAVASDNQPAINLLEKLGFTIGGHVPDLGKKPDMQANASSAQRQLVNQLNGSYAQAQSRDASVQQPSLIGTGLQIAGSTMSAYNSSQAAKARASGSAAGSNPYGFSMPGSTS